MKGEKAEYTIPLAFVFSQPRTKRLRKLVAEVRRFAKKHTRTDKISVAMEVNEYLNKNASKLPRRIDTVFIKKDDKIFVYLKDGKQLALDEKKVVETKKKEAEKKKEKEVKAAEKKAEKKDDKPKEDKAKSEDKEEKDAGKEREKQLLKEKKERERIAYKAEMK